MRRKIMKITNNLGNEIKELFLQDWKAYMEDNDIEKDEDYIDNLDAYIEEWVPEHEDYYDAIIEEVDSLDEVEYLTDQLDYKKYQEAEAELYDFIENIKEEEE